MDVGRLAFAGRGCGHAVGGNTETKRRVNECIVCAKTTVGIRMNDHEERMNGPRHDHAFLTKAKTNTKTTLPRGIRATGTTNKDTHTHSQARKKVVVVQVNAVC